MGSWESWIGRQEISSDRVDVVRVDRWLATFDRPPTADSTVPQGFHWCLCPPSAPGANLGPDGHPRRDDCTGSFLPPVPLPRRMWAASSVEFLRPLRVDELVTRRSTIRSVTAKKGATGPMVFVEIEHETIASGQTAVREVQTIVYREASAPGSARLPAPYTSSAATELPGWDARRVIIPLEVLLFRFSALTFNAHRIHYDLPYAQSEEGYRGLVVHGPLTAALLMDIARREFGDNALTTFSFKGVSPAICGEPLNLLLRGNGAKIELAASAEDGRTVMTARADLARVTCPD